MAGTDSDGSMTIDELAHEAGIPSSTVRLYQQRGLLPPPQRRGRVGYYGTEHRERLRLIAQLQDRGFSLAAIKDALDAWADGRSLGSLLGVADVVPSLVERPLRLSVAELAERFAGLGLTQEQLVKAVEIGLIELDGSEVVIRTPAFAELGPAVAALGVPIDVILEEYQATRDLVAAIAERFRAVFDQHVWAGFVASGMPADAVPRLTHDIERLAQLATEVVGAELHRRFATTAGLYLDRATRSVVEPRTT